jgi:type IV secretion system protein VirB9
MKTAMASLVGFALVAVLSAAPAFGAGIDGTENQQTPIRSVVANNRTPIEIDVVRGDPLLIEFNDFELVNDIAVGGVKSWKDSWEIVKKNSRVFVRLFGQNEHQRKMIITTLYHSYVFYLDPHDKRNGLDYVSKLIVSFERPVPTGSFAPAKPAAATVTADAPVIPRQPVFTKRNYAYTMQVVSESVDIRPRAAWDDGRFTYFIFPKNIPIPAIYRTVPGSDEEAEVNWHIENDDEVVVHGISPAWNLRFGKSVIGVFNDKYNAVGVGTPNKTTTVEVREPK